MEMFDPAGRVPSSQLIITPEHRRMALELATDHLRSDLIVIGWPDVGGTRADLLSPD